MGQTNIPRKGPSTIWTRNATTLALVVRVAFGLVWLIDGMVKFIWLGPSDVVNIVQTVGQGQPSWLAPWFNFWGSFISSNASFALYGVGLVELALGITLVFGLMRKLSYLSGIFLSLLIWTVDRSSWAPWALAPPTSAQRPSMCSCTWLCSGIDFAL